MVDSWFIRGSPHIHHPFMRRFIVNLAFVWRNVLRYVSNYDRLFDSMTSTAKTRINLRNQTEVQITKKFLLKQGLNQRLNLLSTVQKMHSTTTVQIIYGDTERFNN